MSYTLKRYSGDTLVTVEEGTVEEKSSSLSFVGKNFAGYGTYQNENFLYLLENFAGNNPPANAVDGQIWYNKSEKRLKYYDSTITAPGSDKWRTTGGSYTGLTQPASNLNEGDFWFDTNTGQLKVWAPGLNPDSDFVVVGPQAVEGASQTNLESVSLKDNLGSATANYHAVVKAVTNGNTMFVISSDADFDLDTSANPITGFTTIKKGITLVNTPNDSNSGHTPGVTTTSVRFWGTASNSDKLGGLAPTSYILKDSAAFTSSASFPATGITIGDSPTNDIKIFVDTGIGTIKNQASSTLSFKITNSTVVREPLRISNFDVIPGITDTYNLGTVSYKWNDFYAKTIRGSSYVDVVPLTTETYNLGTSPLRWNNLFAKTITADSFVGAIAGNSTSANTLLWNGAYRSATNNSTGSTIVARDSSGDFAANIITAITTQARYADLAEKYDADDVYDPGTVVVFGGAREITVTTIEEDTRVAGVISTNPAYLMNVDSEGLAVALRGKVPCKVVGPVRKGDILVSSSTTGCAMASSSNNPLAAAIIGKSLEDKFDSDFGIIMIVVT
jgi:hypothetical protein